MNEKRRCSWCNINNPKYVEYHDNEWCHPNFSDEYLYELLILECFQAGLSWECVLNKRENFRGESVIYETGQTTNEISDRLSADLKKRGMRFVGSTTIYSFLQSVGIIYSHDKDCYLFRNK